jgi:hypothetical protein
VPARLLIEERHELDDGAKRPASAVPYEDVSPTYEARRDGPLELAHRGEGERRARLGLDDPAVIVSRALNAKLVPTLRALDRGPLARDERVIELVLGLAFFTPNVHACRSSTLS